MGKWTYLRVSDVVVQSIAYFDRKVSFFIKMPLSLWKTNKKYLFARRCLLSKGFSRLGKWFFPIKQAQDAAANGRRYVLFCSSSSSKQKQTFNTNFSYFSDKPNDDTVVTFTFNFFLHGDSTVCSNVDGQQHANVYMITSEDLQAAQSISGGLRGT